MLRFDVGGPGAPGGMPPQGGNPDEFAKNFLKGQGIDTTGMTREQIAAKMSEYGFQPPQPPQQQGMSMSQGLIRPAEVSIPEGSRTFNYNPMSGNIPQDPVQLAQFVKDGARQAGCSEREFAGMVGLPDRPQIPDEAGRMTKKDRKEWIKNYCAENNCSKKEAKEAFKSNFEPIKKMSRKDALSWVKNYKETHNCSKNEAKEAFRQEFGYDVPLNTLQKVGRALVVPAMGAFVALTAIPTAGLTGMVAAGVMTTAGGIGAATSGFITGTNPDDKLYQPKT